MVSMRIQRLLGSTLPCNVPFASESLALPIHFPIRIGDVEVELVDIGFKRFSRSKSVQLTRAGQVEFEDLGFAEIRFTNSHSALPLSLKYQDVKHYDNHGRYVHPSSFRSVYSSLVMPQESVVNRYCFKPSRTARLIQFSCVLPISKTLRDNFVDIKYQRFGAQIPVNRGPIVVYHSAHVHFPSSLRDRGHLNQAQSSPSENSSADLSGI